MKKKKSQHVLHSVKIKLTDDQVSQLRKVWTEYGQGNRLLWAEPSVFTDSPRDGTMTVRVLSVELSAALRNSVVLAGANGS